MAVLFLWILFFFWWDFFLILICRRRVVCILSLLHSFLVLFIFGVWVSGSFLWRAGSYFSICVGFRCVECRAGTFYLGASRGGWRDCIGFLFWALLWWVRYGWNGGGCGLFFLAFFSFLSAVVAGGCLWYAPFSYIFLFGFILVYLSILCFISC